ncbi:molybdate ABC transporter substrate-binding protein [Arthrobacter sp. MYb227]|uniref:molybdate ABC transporter substrate-binding protein n=1 Tax=Arthrobacter sp. MYb227 TaxID=1848601 RepID=UPI0015E38368|nr:molybdate ABC transporter substrate-binding protein [Arthrobacter sp. MYb227]
MGLIVGLALAGCSVGVESPVGGSSEPVETSFDFFAAASLTDVAPELVQAYNATHDPDFQVSLNFGASSKLVAQINGGEKPALLVTADTQSIKALERPEEYETPQDIAVNHLVLAVTTESEIKDIAGIPGDKTVALCAPAVPCGRAAATYLAAHPDFTGVFTEEVDVRSVLTKITSHQADTGFVYATDVASTNGKVQGFALEGVEPNTYPLLVNKDASGAASDFAQWLHTEDAKAILKKAGFDTP